MTDRQHFDPTRHSGRRVLVTGAASGIGRATAVRLAHEGAVVFGCDVDKDGLAETGRQIGARDRMWRCDVAVQSDVDELATRLADGGLDALANIAGISDDFTPPGEVTDEVWNKVLDVNLTGVLRVSRAMLPLLRARQGGSVINIGSIASHSGGFAGVSYTVAKHGVLGLTRSIAHLYGPSGLRCNAICPGAVLTPMGTDVTPPSPWAVELMMPQWQRSTRVEPDRIAAVVSWLASEDASHVNGAVLTVDGGFTTG